MNSVWLVSRVYLRSIWHIKRDLRALIRLNYKITADIERGFTPHRAGRTSAELGYFPFRLGQIDDKANLFLITVEASPYLRSVTNCTFLALVPIH